MLEKAGLQDIFSNGMVHGDPIKNRIAVNHSIRKTLRAIIYQNFVLKYEKPHKRLFLNIRKTNLYTFEIVRFLLFFWKKSKKTDMKRIFGKL